MFTGFAKRIEALEQQISLWESKARKEDKWKKCVEMWLLKHFDFDIQENLSKIPDLDEPEDKVTPHCDEPVISYNNCFQPPPKQVYNNPHLIIESQQQQQQHHHSYDGEQSGGISLTIKNDSSSHHGVDGESAMSSQNHSQQFFQIQPAHLTSQQPQSRVQLSSISSYNSVGSDRSRNKERYDVVAANLQQRPVSKQGTTTTAASTAAVVERKSSPCSSSSSSGPISLQKVPHNVQSVPSSPPLAPSGHIVTSHIGSSITLTPLPLLAHNNNHNSSQTTSERHLENNTPAHLSNNIRHNITSLIGSTNPYVVKDEGVSHENEADDEQEWQDEEEAYDPTAHFQANQLEIHNRTMNHEGSSESRNSPLDLDISEDMEEISNVEEHKHNPAVGCLPVENLHDHVYKCGTNYYPNPKNLPICNFCGKTYSSQTYLKTHIDVVHKGMKSFRCKLCGVCFGFKSDLTRHLRSHMKRKANVV